MAHMLEAQHWLSFLRLIMHDTNKEIKSQSAFAELVYYYIYGYVMMICLQTAIAFCISYIAVRASQCKKSASLVLRIYILNQIIEYIYIESNNEHSLYAKG